MIPTWPAKIRSSVSPSNSMATPSSSFRSVTSTTRRQCACTCGTLRKRWDVTTSAQVDSADAASRLPFRKVEPALGDRYTTCVPLVPLQAAAGGFGDPAGDLMTDSEWVQIRSKYALKEGMFVAQVVGKSMEPRIADGAYCLFQGPVIGSREGKILLVRLRDDVDPDTGERFTIKQYTSEKKYSDDGTWTHKTITLCPINSQFQPIVLTGDDAEDRCDVVAELIEVLK